MNENWKILIKNFENHPKYANNYKIWIEQVKII